MLLKKRIIIDIIINKYYNKKVMFMVRKAVYDDIDKIITIIEDAKALLKNNHSLQWQDSDGYPNRKTVYADIEKGWLYVNIRNNSLAGIVTLVAVADESYKKIEAGNWLNNRRYYAIHRLAVKKEFYRQGVARELLDYTTTITKQNGVYDLRTDTTEENSSMHCLLEKCGFIRCGIVYLVRSDCPDPKRIAFHKVLK